MKNWVELQNLKGFQKFKNLNIFKRPFIKRKLKKDKQKNIKNVYMKKIWKKEESLDLLLFNSYTNSFNKLTKSFNLLFYSIKNYSLNQNLFLFIENNF